MRSPARIEEDLTSPRGDVIEATILGEHQCVVASERELVVVSDIADDFPIGPAELAAIETYFGDLLDMVFGGRKDAEMTLSRHKRGR